MATWPHFIITEKDDRKLARNSECRSNGFNFVTNKYKIVKIGPDNGVYLIDIETKTVTLLAPSDSMT